MPIVIEGTEANFDAEVIKSVLPVLAVFKSEWCSSCIRLTPVFEALSDQYKDKVKFIKFDVMKNPNVTASNNVLAIPTLVFFKSGKETERFSGYLPENDLKALIDKNIR